MINNLNLPTSAYEMADIELKCVVVPDFTETISLLNDLENSLPLRIQTEVNKEISSQLDEHQDAFRRFKNEIASQVFNMSGQVEHLKLQYKKMVEQVHNCNEGATILDNRIGQVEATTRNLVRAIREIVMSMVGFPRRTCKWVMNLLAPSSDPEPPSQQSFPVPANDKPSPIATQKGLRSSQRKGPNQFSSVVSCVGEQSPKENCPHCGKELSRNYVARHIRNRCKAARR